MSVAAFDYFCPRTIHLMTMTYSVQRSTTRFLLLVAIALCVGCQDDMSTVRKIQAARQARQKAETKVDHVGESISLVSRLIELDGESAGRQIVYHLNAWNQSQEAKRNQGATTGGQSPSENEFRPTRLLRTIEELISYDEAVKTVSQAEFVPLDVYNLRYCYLLRKVTDWVLENSPDDPLWQHWVDDNRKALGEENSNSLASAIKLFDWVTRNIALEPMVFGNEAPPVPRLPMNMEFRGAGYRQTPYETLFRGTGDALQRSTTFISLCRQASIPACMLGVVDSSGNFSPWITGVMVGKELYLFDCGLGVPVPGPNQVGIATLSEARSDASVLRRMSVPGWFEYPVKKDDIQQCAAMLALEPETMSVRSKRLQEALTGDLRLVLYEDADAIADALEALPGIASVKIWDVPLKARVYNAALQQIAKNNPVVAFFTLAEWTILEGEFDQAKRLAQGRWRHLQGIFEDDDEDSTQGAKSLFLSQRQPEFEIADLRIDVELQKQYGIRRTLGVTPEIYDRQIQQVQQIMRQGKNTATFWIALIQYENSRFDLAENWFGTRVLGDKQASRWEQAARYNLARSLETLDQADKAIELYKTEGDLQEHGNRIRARLLAKSKGDSSDAEEPQN